MSSKRILVIDDEEAVQEVIQGCLEELADWQVLLASSGGEGLAIASTEPLDAILLDVSMPLMNGVETFQKLQANPVTQAIPVILLTAKVQPAEQAQFGQLSLAGMIAKPFDPMMLVAQIAQILGWPD
jgi:CheY-like chemotaxis protein